MDSFIIPKCSIVITHRCTLKCKLCGDYIPYIKNPKDIPLNQFKFIVDKIFEFTDGVEDFSISGGEPLMHLQLKEILEHVLLYKNKIKRLLILTNGTLLPNVESLKIMKSNFDIIQVNISNYGCLSSKSQELVQLLSENGIPCREIKYFGKDAFCGGWVDYGNHEQKFFAETDVIKNAQKCIFRDEKFRSLYINNGGIYKCGRAHRRMDLGIIPKNEEEYINLFKKNLTKEEFRRLVKNIINAKYSTSCKYCYGLNDEQQRFPAAEQLQK